MADLGASSTEAAPLCDEFPPPDRPLSLVAALALIISLEAVHLFCCLQQHYLTITKLLLLTQKEEHSGLSGDPGTMIRLLEIPEKAL